MKTVIAVVILLLTPPRPGVRAELVVHRPLGGAVWEERRAGVCVSDAQGVCEIRVRVEAWADGLIRGVLRLEEGGERPLSWPGGEIVVAWNGERAGDLRYDPLEEADAPVTAARRIAWPLLALAALTLAGSAVLYRRVKRSERGCA